MVKEIPLTEFINDVEQGLISDCVFIGNTTNRVYGKSVKGQTSNLKGFEVVYAKVP